MSAHAHPALRFDVLPAALAGRCANGNERGRGSVIHAVPAQDGNVIEHERSLCGAEPGRRSAGWSARWSAQVTCQRCLCRLTSWSRA